MPCCAPCCAFGEFCRVFGLCIEGPVQDHVLLLVLIYGYGYFFGHQDTCTADVVGCNYRIVLLLGMNLNRFVCASAYNTLLCSIALPPPSSFLTHPSDKSLSQLCLLFNTPMRVLLCLWRGRLVSNSRRIHSPVKAVASCLMHAFNTIQCTICETMLLSRVDIRLSTADSLAPSSKVEVTYDYEIQVCHSQVTTLVSS